MTAKNLSKKTKVNAVIIPKAKLIPIPSLLLNDETETAKRVKINVENGTLNLLCLTNKCSLSKGDPLSVSFSIKSLSSK